MVPEFTVKRALPNAIPEAASAALTDWGPGPELITHARPRSKAAEAYRGLRTSLLLLSGKPRVFCFTSSVAGEGKSTTTANFATALAQKGSRVLLIDCDLRRANVHRLFGIANNVGLSSLLAGNESSENCVRKLSWLPTLDVLPAGPPPPLPSEMLSSGAFQELLRLFMTLYDYVIIDTPPVSAVTDPVIIATQADATVVVVRMGRVTKQALRVTMSTLERNKVRVAGILLNGVDVATERYYYQSYYGYGYGDGYKISKYYTDETETDEI